MRKRYFTIGDKVIRPYKDTFLYGTITDFRNQTVGFQTPEGFTFYSDPGHLEVIDEESKDK